MANKTPSLLEDIDRYSTITNRKRIFVIKYYHAKFSIINNQNNGAMRLLRIKSKLQLD